MWGGVGEEWGLPFGRQCPAGKFIRLVYMHIDKEHTE